MAKEKTKLKNLTVKKVDFVDAGANQGSHILLTKSKEPELEEEGFWKGLKTYIKTHMFAGSGISQVDVDDIEKSGAQTFGDKMSEHNIDRIRDEMWNVCYALQSSFISILMDGDLNNEQKKGAMEQSASEFSEAIGGFIFQWSRGCMANVEKCKDKIFEPEADILKSMRGVLDQMIEKAQGEQLEHPALPVGLEKGGNVEMKIDKSKMSPEDKQKFEEMAKAYGWGDGPEGGDNGIEGVTPTAANPPMENTRSMIDSGNAPVSEGLGIEKGLHPEFAAELEALRKMRESFEERELRDVAKKYEVIGKKADELVPQLKILKASGDAAYNNYIAILDEMVGIQNSSGLFNEIGKSGGHVPTGATQEDEAFAKARSKAAEIRKSRPELTEAQAIDMAILESPELQEALM